MGVLVQYHPTYINRLAHVYLDVYDTNGFKEAVEWHKNTLKDDAKLKRLLYEEIRRIAPERGVFVKD